MAIPLSDPAMSLLLITFGVIVVAAGIVAALVAFSEMFTHVVR